jgi:hypothetical protein
MDPKKDNPSSRQDLTNYLSGNYKTNDDNSMRSLVYGIANGLAGEKEDNDLAVAALVKYRDENKKDPEWPNIVDHAPPIPLGAMVRSKEVTPTDYAVDLFKTKTGEALPGTGDFSSQEWDYQDWNLGFAASDYQSGKTPTSLEKMEVSENNGLSKGIEFPEQEKKSMDQLFGPSRAWMGALSGNKDGLEKGIEECEKTGLPLFSNSNEKAQGFSFLTSPNTLLKDAALGLEKQAEKLQKQGQLVMGFADLAMGGKGNVETQDFFKNMQERAGDLNKFLTGEGNENNSLQKQNEEADNARYAKLAGAIAGNAAYRNARSKGFNPKQAGDMADSASDAAIEAASAAQKQPEDKTKDVVSGLASGTKNLAVKTASNLALAIPPPGLGKAISIGIVMADKAVDLLAESMAQQTGSLEKGSKAAEQGLGGKDSVSDPDAIPDSFKQEMTKTKTGIVKKLSPSGDLTNDALKGMMSIGNMGKSSIDESNKVKEVDQVHQELDRM